jgi:thiol:disulfide interchange protein DsbD
VADLQAQLTQASQNNQPVMLDFYADWCVECLIMERTLFADTQVKQQLAGTVTLQADVTANDATDRELMRFLGVIGPPTVLFFDRQGQERRDYRIVGALNLREFTAHLSAVLPSKENRGEDKDE